MKPRKHFPAWIALLIAMSLGACSGRSAADQANAQSTGTAQAVINANAWGTQAVLDRIATSDAVMAEALRWTPKPREPISEPPRRTPRPTAPPPALQIHLLYYSDENFEWMESEIAPAFEEAHPEITVEFIWVDLQVHSDILSAWLSGGDSPDIVTLSSEHNAVWGSELADLSEELNQWQHLPAFIPSTLDAVTWEGELRGLPLFIEPRNVMCRTDLMAAAGYDSQPTDFAGWVQFAQDATIFDKQAHAMLQMGLTPVDSVTMVDAQWFLNTFWSLGGELYKADGTPNFDSPEATAALKFYGDLKRAMYPDDYYGQPLTGNGPVIGDSNESVCLWHLPWGAPARDNPIWQSIDIQPFFGDATNFPNSRPISLADVHWLAVPEYSRNRELAVEFLKFISSAENNNRYNETISMIPARQDAHYGFVADNPVLARQAELAVDYTYAYAGILEPAALQEILHYELVTYLFDGQDLETTQRNIQEKYSAALQPMEP